MTMNILKYNWYEISKIGIALSKVSVLLFLFFLLAQLTLKFIVKPYSYSLAGIEFAGTVLYFFTIMRDNTFRPQKKYDTSKINFKNEQLELLLANLSNDISRYNGASSYYLRRVAWYKYTTICLSALSTIVLGLNWKNIELGENVITYSLFSKNVALIIGAIITATTALSTYWNFEKYWLTNKTIANKLGSLKDKIENADGAKNLDIILVQKMFEEYHSIKGDFYKYWEGALADRGSQSKTSSTVKHSEA